MVHPKEQMIIDYIKKLKAERESKYLGYRLKYGKYKNSTLHDVFQTKRGIGYILWLRKNTASKHFKQVLSIAANEELKLSTV